MKYETQNDLQNEEWVLDYLAESHTWANYKFRKLDLKYSVDYAISELGSNDIIGYAEIKCYKVPYSTYSSTMLSAYKVERGLAISEGFKRKFFHIVRYSDEVVAWQQITYDKCTDLRWGGRKTERHKGNGDREPIWYFNKSDYKVVKKIPR